MKLAKEKEKGAVIRSRAINFLNDKKNQHSISAHLSHKSMQVNLSRKYKKIMAKSLRNKIKF